MAAREGVDDTSVVLIMAPLAVVLSARTSSSDLVSACNDEDARGSVCGVTQSGGRGGDDGSGGWGGNGGGGGLRVQSDVSAYVSGIREARDAASSPMASVPSSTPSMANRSVHGDLGATSGLK